MKGQTEFSAKCALNILLCVYLTLGGYINHITRVLLWNTNVVGFFCSLNALVISDQYLMGEIDSVRVMGNNGRDHSCFYMERHYR